MALSDLKKFKTIEELRMARRGASLGAAGVGLALFLLLTWKPYLRDVAIAWCFFVQLHDSCEHDFERREAEIRCLKGLGLEDED